MFFRSAALPSLGVFLAVKYTWVNFGREVHQILTHPFHFCLSVGIMKMTARGLVLRSVVAAKRAEGLKVASQGNRPLTFVRGRSISYLDRQVGSVSMLTGYVKI